MSDSISNNKRIAKNTLFMYIRMLILMVVSLITTRIIFQILGVVDYGIYNIVGSIIVFFTIINNALTTATRRYIIAEMVNGDIDSKRRVFCTAVISHILIAIIVALLAEAIGLWLINSWLNIPKERMYAANVVYQMSIISAIINIMQAPYTAAITAHEKMSIYTYFSIFEAILKFVVVGSLLIIPGDKLIIYSIVILLTSLILRLLYRNYCKKNFHECTFEISKISKSLFKEIFAFMGWSFFGQAAVVFTNQGVSVLVNIFFSVSANAAMGISNQITSIVTQFVNNFQVAFHPQITKLFVSKNYDELINLTIRSSRITSYLVLFFMIPIIFQIRNFLIIWLGEFPEYSVEFCIFTLTAVYLESVSSPFWMINYSDTQLRSYQIGAALIFSLCFFVGWIVLVLGYPPYSVVIVRTILMGVMISFRIYMVRAKVPSFPIWRWVKEVLITSIIVLVIPCVSLFLFDKVVINNLLLDLLVNCTICVILMGISIYLFGLSQSEKCFVKDKLKSFVQRFIR